MSRCLSVCASVHVIFFKRGSEKRPLKELFSSESKQAGKQAGKQASKQASKETSKEAGRQLSRQASNQAGKHLGGIQLEPCPVGACFLTGLKRGRMKMFPV